jgi:hypothetical protein
MDSTCSKDSIDILFAIFRVTDQKIRILQDWDQIWFEILFQFEFESEQIWARHVAPAHWSIPIRVDHGCDASD